MDAGDRRVQALGIGGQRVDHQVHVGRSERRLPVLGRARTRVAQHVRPRGHACRNSGRKLASVASGTPSALRPWNLSATAAKSARSGGGGAAGGDERDHPPQQLPAVAPIVDAYDEHGPGVAGGTRVQQRRLDVVALEAVARSVDQEELP